VTARVRRLTLAFGALHEGPKAFGRQSYNCNTFFPH
jgi:hypothetical protein